MSNQWQREQEALERDLAEGRITLKEYNRELRELERDYQAAAEQSAHDAYERELDNWF